MAKNVRNFRRPTWKVTSCAAAHTSGDLVFEDGKVGVAVQTNLISTRNILVTGGTVTVPCPGGLAEGTLLYFPTASLTAGATVQAAPSGTTNVATTLQTSSGSATAMGRSTTAAYAMGASTVCDLRLADAT